MPIGRKTKSLSFTDDLEETCLALLNGDPVKIPDGQTQFLFAFAHEQGVAPLIYEQLVHHPPIEKIPDELLADLKAAAQHEAAMELMRQHELKQVLNALVGINIKPLLTKGTPLAYTLYPSPNLRPRCDIDLLIAPADKDKAFRLLQELGYRFPNVTSGKFVMHQASCIKQINGCLPIQFDIHWHISNRPHFARMLSHKKLLKNAIPVHQLGPHAYTLGLKDALLYACLHRAGHISEGLGNRLIWLYDIHLMISALTDSELNTFVERARDGAVSTLCLDAFQQAQKRFDTKIPDCAMLQLITDSKKDEISAGYLSQSKQSSIIADLQSLPGIKSKLTLLREHLLPPKDYMLKKYQTDNQLALPMLYLRRLISGIVKLFN